MKTIDFIIDNNSLILVYSPDVFYSGLIEKYRKTEELTIKRCFSVTTDDEYRLEENDWFDADESVAFKIGEKTGDYFKMKKGIFGTSHDFYFHVDIRFKSELFVASRNISILHKLDSMITGDLYIGGQNETYVPMSVYYELIDKFPTSYELTLYSHKRVAQVLKNYIDGLGKVTDRYEKHLNQRLNSSVDDTFHYENELKLSILTSVYDRMKWMLSEEDGFSEKQWQEIVKDALLLIYPKYIWAEREVTVGTDGRHKKAPDFILIDSSGFVDILEIKKPNNQRLITKTKYRNNYVADRDLSGAIVQIEKYVQCLNHSGKAGEKMLQKRLRDKIPGNIAIKAVNPVGMLLMGRGDGLSCEQLIDLEIIKRQHKNIVDIMTYDDLIYRLKNMIAQLERQV